MKSVVAYVRNLLGWTDETPVIRSSFKRDRGDDGFLAEDDSPASKRLRFLKRTSFPDLMSNDDEFGKDDRPSKNVRYVPIEVEAGHPSTSTPYDSGKLSSRVRNVPIQLVEVPHNGPATPYRHPRLHTPVRPPTGYRAVIDDDDEPQEVKYIQKSEKSKKPTQVFINLADDDEPEETDDNEVIFVKKVPSAPPSLPPSKPQYHYVLTRDQDEPDTVDDDTVHFYRLGRKNERCSSPRTNSKFKAPPGISKIYRKPPAPVSRWLQPQKGSLLRNKYASLNGNSRSTLSEVFNLDEKRNYQELIRRVTGHVRPVHVSKPLEVINSAEDFASFRNTLRAQRQSLHGMRQVERDLLTDKEGEVAQEYDPITIASINSSDSEVEVVPSESSSSSARIEPINTFKDSLRNNPVAANDWLTKLDSKYKKKWQETQEKVKDVRRESDIISKVNFEQGLAHLQHKLKHELSLPDSLIEEPQPVAELPKLSAEQEKLVNRALGPGPAGQLLVEKFNLRIHRRDLQTLSGLNWLNDEVINFYMNLIMARAEQRPELPRVYATNTFFYPKLMQAGQQGLKRWTRKVDIFAHDLMAIPVHLGVHWCMSLVDFKNKKISYLDSMGGRNQACLSALMQYLKDEHRDKKGQPFDDSGWKSDCLKDIPQQMNGSDCGMFACTFAEFSARGAPYSFSQQHMPYLRRKAALEILQGKLLL